MNPTCPQLTGAYPHSFIRGFHKAGLIFRVSPMGFHRRPDQKAGYFWQGNRASGPARQEPTGRVSHVNFSNLP